MNISFLNTRKTLFVLFFVFLGDMWLYKLTITKKMKKKKKRKEKLIYIILAIVH